MDYQQTLDFLYNRLQAFHNIGAKAYKPGLETTLRLCEAFGNPHLRIKTVHIAGTNGKGSTAHTIAAVMQSAGLRTGLYTSPHLVDFGERIRIDGTQITQAEVIDFVERFQALQTADPTLDPSFFELATVMAFDHFARHNVDIAIIETGLGGRLDSTNVITPLISIITNISLDHTALLGDTLPKIAAEKAGIIKPGVPAVIGEAEDAEVRQVFIDKAASVGAPLLFADQCGMIKNRVGNLYHTREWGDISGQLTGLTQALNARTVFAALQILSAQMPQITKEAVSRGFAEVEQLTGLMGRWMRIADDPGVIIDTGHNPGAWQYLAPRLAKLARPLSIVLGFVADKDVDTILRMLPVDANYYFTQPANQRALPADELANKASLLGLHGRTFAEAPEAYRQAMTDARKNGATIFIGGSNFTAGQILASLPKTNSQTAYL